MSSEGAVYRRKDGRWVVEYHDQQGRRRFRYSGPDGSRLRSERDARRALRAWLNERDKGAGADDPTLGAWCDWWIGQLDRRPTTVADYRYKLSLLPGWLRRRRLSRLTPMDVHEALHELAAGRTIHGRPRAASTVAQVRVVLGHALRQAERYGHVSRNAAQLAAPIRVQPSEVVPLEVEQARALLRQVAGHPLASLYVVALATGLRQGELLGLRWTNVDLDVGVVRVREQLTRTNTNVQVRGDPKTARSRRDVKLPSFAVAALRTHRREQTVVPLDGLVWATSMGTAYQPSNVRRHLRRSCERAGVPPVTFHALRHSAASIMLALGVQEAVIADVLGHADLRVLSRYAHVVDTLRESAADAVDQAFGG